jgi:DNA-nicking Smr family endonuclease
MDFGDILENWEESNKKTPGKIQAGQNLVGGVLKRTATGIRSDGSHSGSSQPDKPQDGQAWRNKKTGPQKKASPVPAQERGDVLDGTYHAGQLSSANPMDIWLRRYGVTDKDAAAEAYEQTQMQNDREQIRSMPPEAHIDLHGLTRDEAWTRLELFIAECCRKKLRKVLIIHGKGNHSAETSVLDSMVRTFIEKDTRLGASGHPDRRNGGKGATWVSIKDTKSTLM